MAAALCRALGYGYSKLMDQVDVGASFPGSAMPLALVLLWHAPWARVLESCCCGTLPNPLAMAMVGGGAIVAGSVGASSGCVAASAQLLGNGMLASLCA